MQVIKQQLTTLGLIDKCDFVYNGQEAVLRASTLLLSGKQISYILTDFMMPRLNGIQAIQKIKTFIQNQNFTREVKIREPKYVFLTAYKTSAFDKHIQELNVHEVYEKPLQLEQLR